MRGRKYSAYHVLTSPELYFGRNGEPLAALFIWEGGLGIWGAISLGAVGAYISFRYFASRDRTVITFAQFADAIAPGILLAQAIGRFGNWFNQELFGRPTDLPWGLEIEPTKRPPGFSQFETFHPTFLYEAIWCTVVALLLIYLNPRFSPVPGRIFTLYVILYSAGRLLIEQLRIDTASEILGFRLNTWTSLLVILTGIVIYRRLGATKSDEK